MKRGRILTSHHASNIGRDVSQPTNTQPEPPAPEPEQQRQPGIIRGRGARLMSRLASARGRLTENDEKSSSSQRDSSESRQEHDSNSSTGADDGALSRLSRQGSDLSRSSVMSQHFAQVEQTNYKANLPKQASTIGSQVQLSVNYMTFNVIDSHNIEEYHVDFNPQIESIRLRYMILRSEPAREVIGNTIHWTGTNLYLPHKLADRVTSFSAPHPSSDGSINVRLTYIKTPPDTELMPFYNSLMHKVMNKLQFVIINRQHYSPMHKIAIEQHKLEVWPGWVTSIQRLDGGIKLAVDASFRVLRLETVRDIMMAIKNRQGAVNLRQALEQELVGSIIMTRYNNKAYRIDGIDVTKKPTDTFTMTRDNNRQISYIDYMREHWAVAVRDPNQPMLIHKPKPKRGEETSEIMYLIPELCVTTGLTDEMRSNFTIMKAIGEHTRLPPDVRESKLIELLQQMSTDERAKSVFEEWNLSVRPQVDIVSGRRLDNETVMFGQQRSTRVPDNVDWTRNAMSGPVFKSVDLESWVIMFTERDANIAEDFMACIRDVSRALGMKLSPPRIIKLPNDSPATYVSAGKREVRRTDQMVVLLTPGRSQREDRYSACKRLYSCDIPVPCQFIRCGTVSDQRKVRSVCQKVMVQILSKVGGQPWAMKFPMRSFMIVGMDVYHDSIDRKRSCVGFVASMNEFTSSWWSHTFFQDSLEEISKKVNATMMQALRKYQSVNGFLPQKIIVYRDGVGDGQLDTVLQFEVVQVMNAIKFYLRDVQADIPEPHLSYIVVQKRINTKMSLRSGPSIVNPLPGTFLDHTITHPDYNDFYLVSQHVNQGTVSPTKYVILTETGTLKMEHHQKLAYKMTHMYYNWTGTIRVPAPCQYAHKLAYLTGQNIRQPAHEVLQDRLYYL